MYNSSSIQFCSVAFSAQTIAERYVTGEVDRGKESIDAGRGEPNDTIEKIFTDGGVFL
jgi:hypothetical protein